MSSYDQYEGVTISTKLRPEEAQRLAAVAIEQHTSRSRLVREAVRAMLAEQGGDNGDH
jgi:hypothetical protein